MNTFEYLTIDIPFTVKNNDAKLIWWTAWFSKLCAHRLLDDMKNNNVFFNFSQTSFLRYARKRCYDLLPNRRYIDGVATLIYSTLRSARKLGINIKNIELRQWLLFQSEAEKEKKGNLNIRLESVDKVKILVFNHRKESEKIAVDLRTPKGYRKVLETLIEKALNKEVGYPARIVVKEYNFYPFNLHLYCSLQVIIPYNLYLETMRKYVKPLGDNVAGIDVNVDRLNLAIVDKYGRLRDTKTFWFREITSRGYKRKPAWTKIHQAIHDMLNYAYHHGVAVLALESPKIVGYLRYYWIRNGDRKSKSYNYKKSIFRNKILRVITYKAPLYSIKTIYVNPKGTTHSKKHHKVMKYFGLDRHMASAYIIALKCIKVYNITKNMSG